jgi:type II secretion system protein H
MVLMALRGVKVKIKTLPAGNRGLTPLENAPGEIDGSYLAKLDVAVKLLSKQTVQLRSSPQTGFTLLELLLVLFIVGLSAAVVMFSGSRLQEKTMFNTEARKLYLTVKHARELSIIERRDIVVKVDGESRRYWIDYGNDQPPEMQSITQKYTLVGEDIVFFPKGNSSGGKLEIDNGKGQKYEVTVEPLLGTTSIKRL